MVKHHAVGYGCPNAQVIRSCLHKQASAKLFDHGKYLIRAYTVFDIISI